MRLFALEYYRQMINSDLVHFTKAKKKAQLRIKDHLGPFVCNTREAWKVGEQILENELKLNKSFSRNPYDPHSFICDRRMKNKLSPYLHHRIPKIEKFSNMDESREGTRVEIDSDQANIENVMKDLEKTLDLDSFEQVQFETSQRSASGISASTTDTSQRHSQETSRPLAGTSQGREKETSTQATEQSTMSKQPETS